MQLDVKVPSDSLPSPSASSELDEQDSVQQKTLTSSSPTRKVRYELSTTCLLILTSIINSLWTKAKKIVNYAESSEDEDDVVMPSKSRPTRNRNRARAAVLDEDDDDDEYEGAEDLMDLDDGMYTNSRHCMLEKTC